MKTIPDIVKERPAPPRLTLRSNPSSYYAARYKKGDLVEVFFRDTAERKFGKIMGEARSMGEYLVEFSKSPYVSEWAHGDIMHKGKYVIQRKVQTEWEN